MFSKDDVIKFCEDKYKTHPDHPWTKYPEYTVLRHADNEKWYGLLMNVPADKLGLQGSKVMWVLNVKLEPIYVQGLLQSPGFVPAYHMNKEDWISILLDGSVPDSKIEELIKESFALTR